MGVNRMVESYRNGETSSKGKERRKGCDNGCLTTMAQFSEPFKRSQ